MRPMIRHAVKPAVIAGVTVLMTLLGADGALAAPSAATLAARQPSAARSAVLAACPVDGAQAAADSYLAALTSHDASAVPFAPDVLRVEDGIVTGRSADEIRQDLDTSLKYRIITALRDRTYSQSGPSANGTVTVNVHYLLDIGAPSLTVLTVQVQERFDVQCGEITYINATILP